MQWGLEADPTAKARVNNQKGGGWTESLVKNNLSLKWNCLALEEER